MAIEKGQTWGTPGVLPATAPVVSSDAALAALIDPGGQSGELIVGLDGGDLARTLGVRGPFDRGTAKQLLPVDAILIELDDGSMYVCVAHTVAGDLLRTRGTVAIMNAAFIGPYNLAPRAHPGDGKADVVGFDLGLADRFKARSRMATGAHVPHPHIPVNRRVSGLVELGRRFRITIDGQRCGRSETLRYTVIPEAVTVAVS